MPAIRAADLEGLFGDLVATVVPRGWRAGQRGLLALARVALRRVYADDETAELRGIASATGLPLYLLVAFNVLLDLLLGCTSGGVRMAYCDGDAEGDAGERAGAARGARAARKPVAAAAAIPSKSRIVHFRTLDWDMDELRHLIVELDFVRAAGGPVVATTVGYFGYVGALTGVRRGLSLSLNFRPTHDRSTWRKRAAYRWHQAMVLLGRRPSISSTLRYYLLGPAAPGTEPLRRRRDGRAAVEHPAASSSPLAPGEVKPDTPNAELENSHEQQDPHDLNIDSLLAELTHSPSTAAYLIFSTAQRTYAVEKDHLAAVVRSDGTLMTTCNHDVGDESAPERVAAAAAAVAETGMVSLVEDSMDRKRTVRKVWRAAVRRQREQQARRSAVLRRRGHARSSPPEASSQLRARQDPIEQDQRHEIAEQEEQDRRVPLPADGVLIDDVLKMLGHEYITHDQTHYAVVMDPLTGRVLWRRAYALDELGSDNSGSERDG
ncbi:hypothetical protein B0T26DRAFT_724229 [Lasiosphaeria miniovina]|uniref:ceramidase n=1 Tax=Lasiosphaeria miniovina TaxID=1954250 RepID=A0AA40A6J7_9PEZI|nr:uncharacterized protein B0T26DRAFT_724229 [Lasiosphaeria miniovina]KAK0710157.1 hypothetical protein B0T26DRAFT_724229 [Lasiosphaeria miniovina]